MANKPIPNLEVVERENNNTTDPNANQTGRAYVNVVPPRLRTPAPRAPKGDEDVTVLGWIRKKRGPLA